MKIVAMSDLHGYLPPVDTIPACDVVCICGDISPLDFQDDFLYIFSWFQSQFVPWAESLPCEKVLIIAGNHDFFLNKLHNMNEKIYWDNKNKSWEKEFIRGDATFVDSHLSYLSFHGISKIEYLCDNSCTYKGVSFYGFPYVRNLKGWSFNLSNEEFIEKAEKIPDNIDVLLTHTPPSIFDMGTVLQKRYNQGRRFGDNYLNDLTLKKHIKYVLCGHVHSGNHDCYELNGTHYVNVSIKDEDYRNYYKPFVFEINEAS